ncbi:hypothetical protein COSO111634_11465 [Corallococcus soli]
MLLNRAMHCLLLGDKTLQTRKVPATGVSERPVEPTVAP